MIEFYYCTICGNLMVKLEDAGPIPQCCGEEMEVLKASMTDGAKEKHVPVIHSKTICAADMPELTKVTIEVGSDPHPMEPTHYIQWIILETEKGFFFRKLEPGDPPKACFYLPQKCSIEKVYAYCNIHGLWMK